MKFLNNKRRRKAKGKRVLGIPFTDSSKIRQTSQSNKFSVFHSPNEFFSFPSSSSSSFLSLSFSQNDFRLFLIFPFISIQSSIILALVAVAASVAPHCSLFSISFLTVFVSCCFALFFSNFSLPLLFILSFRPSFAIFPLKNIHHRRRRKIIMCDCSSSGAS